MKIDKIILFVSISLIYNVLLDFLNPESSYQQILVLVQYILLSIPIFYAINKKNDKYFILLIIILLFYLFIISFRSSDLLVTFNHFLKMSLSTMYLLVGYWLIGSESRLKKLIRLLFYLVILFIAYILFVNYFNIGSYLYGEFGLIKTGHLTGARLYQFSIIILVLLSIGKIYVNDFNKYLYYLVSIISFLIILMVLRRSAIIILLIGFITFFLFYPTRGKVLIASSLFLVIGYIGYDNKDEIMELIEFRSSRVTDVSLLTTERRYQEYEAIYLTLNREPVHLLLGSGELFNSRGKYGEEHWRDWGDRRIHSDYGILLHGGGFLALCLYLVFLFSMLYKNFKLKPVYLYLVNFKLLLSSLILVAIVISFMGGMYYVSYNTLNMLLIGSIMRILEEKNIIYNLMHSDYINLK
jgi:hypothetical protein